MNKDFSDLRDEIRAWSKQVSRQLERLPTTDHLMVGAAIIVIAMLLAFTFLPVRF